MDWPPQIGLPAPFTPWPAAGWAADLSLNIPLSKVSVVSVQPIRAFFAVVMVLLWMTGGSHCEVSAACGSLLSADHSHDAGNEPCPSSDESGCDECSLCLSMDAGLVPLTSTSTAPAMPSVAVLFASVSSSDLAPDSLLISETPPPPEEAAGQTWQFLQRVALPVRAPSPAS